MKERKWWIMEFIEVKDNGSAIEVNSFFLLPLPSILGRREKSYSFRALLTFRLEKSASSPPQKISDSASAAARVFT